MTLVACPPSVTMPCVIWPGSICWRSSPIATCATVMRVGGVEPQIRRDGGVRLAARVADRHLRQRQRARAGDVERPGVQHHRGGDVVERARR